MNESPVEFLSRAWLAAVREETQRLLDAEPGDPRNISFTLTERYSDPAVDVPGGDVGFTMTIANGRVDVHGHFADRFDVRVESMWADAAKAVRMTGPDYAAFRDERLKNGRLRYEGDLSSIPPFLGALHDAIARRTL
jgi:hypothetical protein